MMRPLLALLMLMLVAVAGRVAACDCRFGLMDDDDIRAAEHVFVVRVLETRLVEDSANDDRRWASVAKIRVVETLRGDGAQFDSFDFSTSPCCGVRIDAGHYYFVAVSGAGPRFHGHAASLVDVGPFGYDEPPRDPGRRHPAYEQAAEVEAGKRSIDKAFASWLRDLLLQVPPPPPPPPPPSPDDKARCPTPSSP